MNIINKKINGSKILELEHDSLSIYKNKQNLKLLLKKYKNIDKFFQFFNIRIVVKDLHKVVATLENENIIEILDINEFELLKVYCKEIEDNEISTLNNLEFNFLLFEDENFDQDYFMFNTLLKFSPFIKNKKLYFENFNNQVANYLEKKNKKYSDCILNARKCLINSVYGFKTIKRIRNPKNKSSK